MGQSEVLLGICWGTLWELDGNIMKTWWEYIGNNPKKIPKNPAPSPTPKVYFPPFFWWYLKPETPIRAGH
jgi:hypothetical protein